MYSERCSTFCNQLHGIWNTTRGLCHIELFIQSICIRVKSVDGTWVLDTDKFAPFPLLTGSERRLPANRAFQLYDSDGVGCSYSNNWHSVMYDYRKTSAIPIFVLLLGFADSKVRSTSDSYLFASAYTRGCSSETRAESSCFGETRLVKRHVYCVLFVFTLAVCIIETVRSFSILHCSALFCSSFSRKRNGPHGLQSSVVAILFVSTNREQGDGDVRVVYTESSLRERVGLHGQNAVVRQVEYELQPLVLRLLGAEL